jgi:hypothetical protein
MKSKFNRSCMPIALSNKIVFDKFVRYISGTDVGSIS